jgi:hypothetical protein
MDFLQEGDFSYLCNHDLYIPVHNVSDECISIMRASGRGLGPGNREFFRPFEMVLGELIGECHLGPKRNLIDLHGPLRCIKENNLPAQAAPPHYKTYKKSRGNCKVHNTRLQCMKTKWIMAKRQGKPYFGKLGLSHSF